MKFVQDHKGSMVKTKFFKMKPAVKITLIIVVGAVLIASMYFGYFERLLDWCK